MQRTLKHLLCLQFLAYKSTSFHGEQCRQSSILDFHKWLIKFLSNHSLSINLNVEDMVALKNKKNKFIFGFKYSFLFFLILTSSFNIHTTFLTRVCNIERIACPRAYMSQPLLICASAPTRLNLHHQVPYTPLSCLVLCCYRSKVRYVFCVRSN